jgi:phosphatidylglycerol:prolipoprotein diacylglycerol transferase
MSFHGGLLGVAVAGAWFVRKHGLTFGRVSDGLAIAVTPGILLVRLANFFNGELYGRIATGDGPPWAMRFPTDPKAVAVLDLGNLATREREKRILAAFRDGTWDRVKDQVPLRHPSQLYEALGEGVVLGLVLMTVYFATRKRPLGGCAYGGLFLLGYGLFRFVVEFYRQPDQQFADPSQPGDIGTVLGPFSMGQVLCSVMIGVGLWMVWRGFRTRERLAPGS